MTPSSNTLTPIWRTARSRVPPPPTGCFPALSHHPQALTHFECCMNLVGAPAPRDPQIPPLATKSTCVPSSLVQAPLSPGSSQEVTQGSPQLPRFQGEMGIRAGTGRGDPAPPLPLPFCSQLGPRRWLVVGPGGEGGYQRTPGAPSAPPQTSIFLRPCSARGTQPEWGSRACPAH